MGSLAEPTAPGSGGTRSNSWQGGPGRLVTCLHSPWPRVECKAQHVFCNKAPSGASWQKALTQPPAIKGGAVRAEGTRPWVPTDRGTTGQSPRCMPSPAHTPRPQCQALSARCPSSCLRPQRRPWNQSHLLKITPRGGRVGLGCRTLPPSQRP